MSMTLHLHYQWVHSEPRRLPAKSRAQALLGAQGRPAAREYVKCWVDDPPLPSLLVEKLLGRDPYGYVYFVAC